MYCFLEKRTEKELLVVKHPRKQYIFENNTQKNI